MLSVSDLFGKRNGTGPPPGGMGLGLGGGIMICIQKKDDKIPHSETMNIKKSSKGTNRIGTDYYEGENIDVPVVKCG